MDLENIVLKQIQKLEEDGTIDEIVRESIKSSMQEVMKDLFGWKSGVKKLIDKKLEEAMIPAIEDRDWNALIPKLDAVLTEISNMDNLVDRRKIINNFEQLIATGKKFNDVVTEEEIFDKYKSYAADDVDTSNLEVSNDGDGEPYYEWFGISCEFELSDKKSFWNANSQYGTLHFRCEADKNLNRDIELESYNGGPWRINERFNAEIASLRTLDSFSVYIIGLDKAYVQIEVEDGTELTDDVEPSEKPEVSYS